MDPAIEKWSDREGRELTGTRWLALHDALLRGLTHALSNRIATFSASAYMLEYGDVSAAQAAVTLREDTERADVLLQLLRLLPGSEDAALEAVSVREILEQAVALHAHHLELRDVQVTCQIHDDVPPAFVEPHQLLRSVLLLLDRAKHEAYAAAGSVTATLSGDPDRVQLRVRCVANAAADTTDANDNDDDSANTLTLPSLATARREGR